MKKINPIILLFLLIFSSCGSDENINQESPIISEHKNKKEEQIINDKLDPTLGPTCNTKIDKIGQKEMPKGVAHIYFKAPKLDLKNEACTFTIGEIESNEVPDSGIHTQYIYFIDTENFNIPTDSSIFGSGDIKKKVIYIFSNGGDKMEFYPFNPELRKKIVNPLQ